MSPFWIALSLAGAFAVGLLFGILLHKITSPSRKKRRRLEGQIDQIRDEYVRYQAGVTQHFSESAALIRRLNHDYQAVITHLTHGAGKLSADPDLCKKEMLGVSGAGNAADTHEYTAAHLAEALPPDRVGPDHDLGIDYSPELVNDKRSTSLPMPRKTSGAKPSSAPDEPSALHVPGTSASSIQGVKIASKHVKAADYDEQHVDGYVEAPRDYAPRRGPGDDGTLAETYGLQRGDSVKH